MQTPNLDPKANNAYHPNNNESILNTAINLLNLNNRAVPPTPANSLASTNSIPTNLETVDQDTRQVATNRFSTRPPWAPLENSNLTWAWIEGNGPFITNGQSWHQYFEASETKSDTTTVLFNLDSLNEEMPETV